MNTDDKKEWLKKHGHLNVMALHYTGIYETHNGITFFTSSKNPFEDLYKKVNEYLWRECDGQL